MTADHPSATETPDAGAYRTRLAEVCALLNEEGARYVLVGATAMQLWGTTRATRDIDLLIEATKENAERVLAALSRSGFGFAGEWLADTVAAKPVTIIGDSPRVDLMTVAWTVHYPEAVSRATTFALEGVEIPTASIDDLIASKRTGRLQDAADIEVLEEIKRLRG
jgi:predicted nucleotidyltransferase